MLRFKIKVILPWAITFFLTCQRDTTLNLSVETRKQKVLPLVKKTTRGKTSFQISERLVPASDPLSLVRSQSHKNGEDLIVNILFPLQSLISSFRIQHLSSPPPLCYLSLVIPCYLSLFTPTVGVRTATSWEVYVEVTTTGIYLHYLILLLLTPFSSSSSCFFSSASSVVCLSFLILQISLHSALSLTLCESVCARACTHASFTSCFVHAVISTSILPSETSTLRSKINSSFIFYFAPREMNRTLDATPKHLCLPLSNYNVRHLVVSR